MKREEIQKKIAPILRKYGVKRAFIFGSIARGEADKNSDLDLLVTFKDDSIGLFTFYEMVEALENVVGRKVDVATTNSLNKHLAPFVIKEMQQVYEG